MPTELKQDDKSFNSPLTALEDHGGFVRRHIGPDETDTRLMLDTLGIESLEALIESTLPASIQTTDPLNLPTAASEIATVSRLRKIADLNVVKHNII